MSFYPICLDLKGRPCLVVGGGRVAERKVLGLLSCSAQVTVVSPELTDILWQGQAEKSFRWINRAYRPGDLQGAFLAMAATDNEETQKQVYEEAVANNILLNVADVPKRCNFILPASLKQGDLMISISTAGKSPGLARKLRLELEKKYGSEYKTLVEIMGAIRPKILASGRPQPENEQLFKKLLHDDLAAWIRSRDWTRLENHFAAILGDSLEDTWRQEIRTFYL